MDNLDLFYEPRTVVCEQTAAAECVKIRNWNWNLNLNIRMHVHLRS